MEQAPSSPMLKFGPYLVDLAAGEVRKNGSRIRLQEKPLRVLALLAERQGQVVTREELKKHLWPEDTFVDFETVLTTAVSKLRDASPIAPRLPATSKPFPAAATALFLPWNSSMATAHLPRIRGTARSRSPRRLRQPLPTSFQEPRRERYQ